MRDTPGMVLAAADNKVGDNNMAMDTIPNTGLEDREHRQMMYMR